MIDNDTKFGIKMSLFIFLIAGAVVVFIAWLGGLFSENEVNPPPVEAPATTAREEIVTVVCTFGDCPVLRPTEVSVTNSTAAVKFPLTTVKYYVSNGIFNAANIMRGNYGRLKVGDVVTHWMPMPDPPEEELP
jgi:hypothetical protein